MISRNVKRFAIAQLVAWLSFGLAVALFGVPAWIPTPATLAALTALRVG